MENQPTYNQKEIKPTENQVPKKIWIEPEIVNLIIMNGYSQDYVEANSYNDSFYGPS